MDERLSKIKNLIAKVDIKNTDKQLEESIKEKFPDVETYTLRSSNKVRAGSIVRYVDLNLDNLSPCCIVKKISYRTNLDFYEKKIVKNVYLSSGNRFWRIRATKYYIFESNGQVSPLARILKNAYKNNINNEADDEDYMLDQIIKYKNTI